MKNVYYFLIAGVVVLTGCQTETGELIGVKPREQWFQPDPFGMLYIPMGSFHMGPSDQEVPYAHTAQAKVVSVQAFYMDETEITNNEYRQFVHYVRDSIARRLLVEVDEEFQSETDDYGQEFTMHHKESSIPVEKLNWKMKIDWDGEEEREALEELYYPEHERFYRKRQLDTRKLMFEYYWIDWKTAANKSTRDLDLGNGIMSHSDRSKFIIREVVNVYPDTLTWVHDFTYSFNEPMTNMYFWHPAFDDYPVVGVTWKQATAFSVWRTELLNEYIGTCVQDFRLPTEAEWEYAARGGLDHSPYPWGGPYIRNARGCFLGNFKPMRGSYIDDGGFHTVKVMSYAPNDYGLYCMAGNVAEWTANAYDESVYNFAHDLNMDYRYNAKPDDYPTLKRKVLRGGSWKDFGYFLQTGTRTYEYQDTAKSYIGFRNVMTYLGRAKEDKL